MPWTSEKTALHTGEAVPLMRSADGGLIPISRPDDRPWQAYTGGDGGPIAAALYASCTCGFTEATVHPIDRTQTVEDNEQAARDEWVTHASLAALSSGVRLLSELTELLDRLVDTDPRAALALAGRMERRAKQSATQAAAAARTRGDSWSDVGEAGRPRPLRQAAFVKDARQGPGRLDRGPPLWCPAAEAEARPPTGRLPQPMDTVKPWPIMISAPTMTPTVTRMLIRRTVRRSSLMANRTVCHHSLSNFMYFTSLACAVT
ncbi:hypothetical protein AB0C77_12900 [Streptomyces sp. NPDC048629]|uniref:hypothetical protein n=1 Tax=Streptomyces sp. NPDC048629 TaxID=3154824 RepID=UPI00342C225B